MADNPFLEENNAILMREKALKNLEKVKELEKVKLEQGYRYVIIDSITRKLQKL